MVVTRNLGFYVQDRDRSYIDVRNGGEAALLGLDGLVHTLIRGGGG